MRLGLAEKLKSKKSNDMLQKPLLMDIAAPVTKIRPLGFEHSLLRA